MRFCGEAAIPGDDTARGCCGVNVGTGTADADGASWYSTATVSSATCSVEADSFVVFTTFSSEIMVAVVGSVSIFSSRLFSSEASSFSVYESKAIIY